MINMDSVDGVLSTIVGSGEQTQTPDKKDAVKTGANASSIVTPLAILAGLGAVGAAVYFVKRKRDSK